MLEVIKLALFMLNSFSRYSESSSDSVSILVEMIQLGISGADCIRFKMI